SGRVSEVLRGRRSLTLPMIRRLESGLGIPANVLIQTSPKTTRGKAAAKRSGKVKLKPVVARRGA
ncbi:MAG: hypothetical protein ABIZ71_01055, partial [Gemmatimonadales bacterium]